MANMTKDQIYRRLVALLGGEQISILHILNYFESNDLQDFLEFVEDEIENTPTN